MSAKKLSLPPLSIYVHIPWCVKKCPYCDFNSHTSGNTDLPEQAYVERLLEDLKVDLDYVQDRSVESVFIGGGTPSLFSAKSIDKLLNGLANHLNLAADAEITLEANPGTAEQKKFADFYRAGINRLSIGVQSFSEPHLKALGRIHDDQEARWAIDLAHSAGFQRINVDLMHGLPQQSSIQALSDLQTALALGIDHISWYQLTLEKNTVFYKDPPVLPEENDLWSIFEEGQKLLESRGLNAYEISAYAHQDHKSRHNLNYWTFGDYLGIGAGAHGKISMALSENDEPRLIRTRKTRQPKDYLSGDNTQPKAIDQIKTVERIAGEEIAGEFMLNALRLREGFPLSLFRERTGLKQSLLESGLEVATQKNLISKDRLADGWVEPTTQGQLFHNDLVSLFL